VQLKEGTICSSSVDLIKFFNSTVEIVIVWFSHWSLFEVRGESDKDSVEDFTAQKKPDQDEILFCLINVQNSSLLIPTQEMWKHIL
jgi:hypothetical protein